MQRGMFTIRKTLSLMLSLLLVLNLSFLVSASSDNAGSMLPCSLKASVTDMGYHVSIETIGKHPSNAKLYIVSYSGNYIKEVSIHNITLKDGSLDYYPELSGSMLKSTALKFFLWDSELRPLAPSINVYENNLPCTLSAELSDEFYCITVENTGFDMNAKIITAVYKGSDKPVFSTLNVTVQNGRNVFYPGFPTEISDYHSIVKVFLWDSEMHPLAKSVSPLFTFSQVPPNYEPATTSRPANSANGCYEITFRGESSDIEKYLSSVTSVTSDSNLLNREAESITQQNSYSIDAKSGILRLSADNIGKTKEPSVFTVFADGYKEQEIIIGAAAETGNWSAVRAVDDFGIVTYSIDKKDESAIIYFNLDASIQDKELDMSKMRIGLVKVDWYNSTVEYVGKDIRLWGSYRRVSCENQLVPGTYCLENIISNSVTSFKCMLSCEDAARLNNTGYAEKINSPSNGESFVFAMEDGWYEGSAAKYIVAQQCNKVLTINNFVENSVVRYIYDISNEKAIRIVTRKVILPIDCEIIIFCTLFKEPIKEVTLDENTMRRGVDFSDVHR